MELQGIAQQIAEIIERLSKEQPIYPNDIPKVIGKILNKHGFPKIPRDKYSDNYASINCYPGVPTNQCYNFALFISLSSKKYTKGARNHLSCRKAIEKLIQHTIGTCYNTTKCALLLTDSWDVDAYNEWSSVLKQISRKILLEIYLIIDGNASKIL